MRQDSLSSYKPFIQDLADSETSETPRAHPIFSGILKRHPNMAGKAGSIPSVVLECSPEGTIARASIIPASPGDSTLKNHGARLPGREHPGTVEYSRAVFTASSARGPSNEKSRPYEQHVGDHTPAQVIIPGHDRPNAGIRLAEQSGNAHDYGTQAAGTVDQGNSSSERTVSTLPPAYSSIHFT